MTEESTALAVQEPVSMVILPVGKPDELVAGMKAYEATVRAMLDDSDYQSVRGKRFKKRSGLTKLSIAYGVSTEILNVTKERDESGSCIYAEATVRATAPNGRFADGWGACSITESRFQSNEGRQKVDHDIPSTATTRAQNRACSNLFGHGEVSAEEIQASAEPDERTLLLTRIKAYGEAGHADLIRAKCAELVKPGTKVTQLAVPQLEIVLAACEEADEHKDEPVEAEYSDGRPVNTETGEISEPDIPFDQSPEDIEADDLRTRILTYITEQPASEFAVKLDTAIKANGDLEKLETALSGTSLDKLREIGRNIPAEQEVLL